MFGSKQVKEIVDALQSVVLELRELKKVIKENTIESKRQHEEKQ